MGQNKMARMSDIAKKANLNISTVSRALNGSPDISKETRDTVIKIASELGYVTRERRILSRRTIAILIPELLCQEYPEMIHTLRSKMQNNGYDMISIVTGYHPSNIYTALCHVKSYDVSGAFIIFSAIDRTNLNGLFAKLPSIPVTIISEIDTTIPLDTIYISQTQIMQLAASHLQSLGHQSIGYIGEAHSFQRLEELRAVCDRLHMHLMESAVIVGEERFEEGGYRRMKKLLEGPNLPTAVIASYDQMAIGAMRACQEADIRIPRDISIIGIDNIAADAFLTVPLTSVLNPVVQMCSVAAKLMLDQIENPHEHIVQHVSMQPKLVIRESTGRARNLQSSVSSKDEAFPRPVCE